MIKYLQEIWHNLTYREPTPQQRRNARAMRKWWRSFKREGELMIPFILGIIILGFVGYLATTL
jgi:hypothetical protein